MRSPAFQFYPQDFLVGTADMTCEEVGAYIRLLCYQWAKDGLPTDEKKLVQLTGISGGLSLGNVVGKFGLCQDGLLRNARLVKIRQDQDAFHEKQRQNGAKGGNPSFKKGEKNPYYQQVIEDNPPVNPKDNRPLSSGDNPKISSSSSPSSSNNKKRELNGSWKETPLGHEWCKRFLARFGVEYEWGSNDDKAASKLMDRKEGMAEILKWAEGGWRSNDEFLRKLCLTISGFQNNLVRFIPECNQKSKPPSKMVSPQDVLKSMQSQ